MNAMPGFALCVCVLALLTSGDALVLRAKIPNGQARSEANLECSKITMFAAYSLKYPESLLNCVADLRKNVSSAKTHQYNFQGALEDGETMRAPGMSWGRSIEPRNNLRRQWVLDFAKDNFADNDVFFLTDKNHTGDYVAYGLWDHTGDSRDDRYLCGQGRWSSLDATYYKVLAQSNFTLCPGGDYAFSHRFYEAIMAGSIPVVHSWLQDVSMYLGGVGYTYFLSDEVASLKMSSEELKRIADRNYELFMKYQTFILGDNVPPSVPFMRASCSSFLGKIANCPDKCETSDPNYVAKSTSI